MKIHFKPVYTLGLATTLLLTASATLYAQGTPAPASFTQSNGASGVSKRRKTTVAEIVRSIGQAAGVSIVADSSVAQREALPPTDPTTPENFEQQIAALVETLSHGTTWAKLYLPAPNGGVEFNGDDVLAFAQAQSRLLGGTVGSSPAGSVEILGKALPAATAQPYIAGLNLKPVYLVTAPLHASNRAGAPSNAEWSKMTDADRQQYARNQAARLANADLPTRQAFMQEHMAILAQLMQQLSPDQRKLMFEGMGGNIQVHVIQRDTNVSGDTNQSVRM